MDTDSRGKAKIQDRGICESSNPQHPLCAPVSSYLQLELGEPRTNSIDQLSAICGESRAAWPVKAQGRGREPGNRKRSPSPCLEHTPSWAHTVIGVHPNTNLYIFGHAHQLSLKYTVPHSHKALQMYRLCSSAHHHACIFPAACPQHTWLPTTTQSHTSFPNICPDSLLLHVLPTSTHLSYTLTITRILTYLQHTCEYTNPLHTCLASIHAEGFSMFPKAESGANMDWPYGVSEDRWIIIWSQLVCSEFLAMESEDLDLSQKPIFSNFGTLGESFSSPDFSFLIREMAIMPAPVGVSMI